MIDPGIKRFRARLTPAPVRPTGEEIFDSLSPEKQDEMLGPEAADMVRRGEATLSDFVQHDGGFITQKPVEKVKAYDPNQRRNRRGEWSRGGFDSGTESETAVQDRAGRNYRSLFNRIREALGLPNASPPKMTFISSGTGYTTSGVDKWGDVVSIQVSPNAARQLASKDPKVRAAAEYAILHEFGRVFGPTSAYQAPGGNVGAGRANEFANHALRYLNGKVTKRQFRRWAQANMPQWGKDPAMITVPAPDGIKAFDPSKHPRGGDPKNPGRFSRGSGGKGDKHKPRIKHGISPTGYYIDVLPPEAGIDPELVKRSLEFARKLFPAAVTPEIRYNPNLRSHAADVSLYWKGRGKKKHIVRAVLTIGTMMATYPREFQCSVLVHEWGHLSGLAHSTDPNTVMSGEYLDLYPPCHEAFGT